MKNSERDLLNKRIKELPNELNADSLDTYAAFGADCAEIYIPELLAEIYAVKAPVVPEIGAKTCDSCYWQHQTIKYGCADCHEKSEHVFMFSPDAAKNHAELLAKQGKV